MYPTRHAYYMTQKQMVLPLYRLKHVGNQGRRVQGGIPTLQPHPIVWWASEHHTDLKTRKYNTPLKIRLSRTVGPIAVCIWVAQGKLYTRVRENNIKHKFVHPVVSDV